MKTYLLLLSTFLIISCSRSARTSDITYDRAAVLQLTNKDIVKEQKSYKKAVERKREELAIYQNSAPVSVKKQKKHSKN